MGAWVRLGGWYVCVRCECECMWHVRVWCVSVWVQEEKGGGGNLWFTVSSNLPRILYLCFYPNIPCNVISPISFVFKYSDTCRDH